MRMCICFPFSVVCALVMCPCMYVFSISPAEDDFHSIYSELVTIKANYYQLGIGLGLPPGELQAIRKGAQDIEQGFAEVLLAWLRCRQNIDSFGHPTWRGLVKVVDSPAGGNNPALAMDIAARHPATSMKIMYNVMQVL